MEGIWWRVYWYELPRNSESFEVSISSNAAILASSCGERFSEVLSPAE